MRIFTNIIVSERYQNWYNMVLVLKKFLDVILGFHTHFQTYRFSGMWLWEEGYFKIRLPNDLFFSSNPLLMIKTSENILLRFIFVVNCGIQTTSDSPIIQDTSDLTAHARPHICVCWTSFLNGMTPTCHLLYTAVMRDDSSPCMNTFFIPAINNHDNYNTPWNC